MPTFWSFLYRVPLFFLRRRNEMFFLDYTIVESFNSSVLNHVFTFHINKKRKLNQVITCVKTLWEVRVDLENCAHFWKISSYAPVNLSNHAISDKIATVSTVVSLHNEYSKTSLHREIAMLKIWADSSLLWERTRLIKLTILIHATELQANWREFLCWTRSTLLVDMLESLKSFIAIRPFSHIILKQKHFSSDLFQIIFQEISPQSLTPDLVEVTPFRSSTICNVAMTLTG